MLDAQTGTLVSGGRSGTVATRGLRGNDFEHECHNPVEASVGGASRFFYCAKASRKERNAGCEGMDRKMLRWSSGEQSPGTFQSDGTDRYAANHHPTVKPAAVMRWLVRLVTREGDTVLDPFTGSGTTGVACIEEGREFVGIERELDYVEISRRRLEAASAQLAIPLPTQDSPSVLRANDTCDTGSQDSLWRETASSDRG